MDAVYGGIIRQVAQGAETSGIEWQVADVGAVLGDGVLCRKSRWGACMT